MTEDELLKMANDESEDDDDDDGEEEDEEQDEDDEEEDKESGDGVLDYVPVILTTPEDRSANTTAECIHNVLVFLPISHQEKEYCILDLLM